MKTTPILLLLILIAASTVTAPARGDSAPTQAQAAFARLKSLTGVWQGRVGDREKGPEATVIYQTTAAGNTVMETLFPGTRHEMVTMYYVDNGKLVLTHYCAAGNQPQMALTKKSSADALDFNFIGGANIRSRRDGHMHSARIRFIAPDALESEWDYFENGKLSDTKKFFLKRKL